MGLNCNGSREIKPSKGNAWAVWNFTVEEATIMYMDISIQGLSAAVSFASKSSYIHVSFTVGSWPGTGPVINFRSATVFFASSSVTTNSSIPCCSLSISALWTSLFLKPKFTCFLSASVYCIEVHHKKLLSNKSVSVHTAKRRNILHILFSVL